MARREAALRGWVRRKTFGLGRRISLVTGGLLLIFLLLVIVINTLLESRAALNSHRANTDYIFATTTDIVTLLSAPQDTEHRLALLAGLMEDESIHSLELVGTDGFSGINLFDDHQPPEDIPAIVGRALDAGQRQVETNGNILTIAQPLQLHGADVAVLKMSFHQEPLWHQVSLVVRRNSALGLFMFILAQIASVFLARRMTSSLRALDTATKAASDGDLDQTVSLRSNDEFEGLAQSFNSLLSTLKGMMAQVNDQAFRDSITGLPNRSWFDIHFERYVQMAAATGTELAVLYLDIDRFKSINDTSGHQAGDDTLADFSKRLRAAAARIGIETINVTDTLKIAALPERRAAMIARVGGDEFCIAVPFALGESLAERIVSEFESQFGDGASSAGVTTSIGLAQFPKDGQTAEQVLRMADAAMYQAKRSGRNRWCRYSLEGHIQMLSNSSTATELLRGIDEQEFTVYLQPQFQVADGRLSGAEALVRWAHPTRGLLTPDRFLPCAREAGLLPEIGRLVCRKSLAAARTIIEQVDEPFSLAINLSMEELSDSGFMADLFDWIEVASLPPDSIDIEVSEGTAMQTDGIVHQRLEGLRGIGLRLAIDDFGVGYSNLGRLKALSFEKLKVDKSLLHGIGQDSESEGLIKAVLDMAEALHAEVIVEGVETEEQLAFLKRLHCAYYQGFLGGRPMPIDAFIRELGNRRGHNPGKSETGT